MTESRLLDALRLRKVFGLYPTGVAVLAALVDGVPEGIAVSSFTSVSLDPPLVSVCIAHSSSTWPRLGSASRIGLSVLSADQEQAGRQLASKEGDRFAGLAWSETPEGAVFLDGAGAWLNLEVEQEVPAGDHDIVLLRVHDLGSEFDTHEPLVFHASQFRRLAC
ncbi:flavin reductase (DIM6/NTAB) family NADH-FMN oxidoreductase RutF [Nocardioides luteus]|uniref:Oxidoreductase n=1 Tax=Nocardioides luteus TaxID=1844 RepID=A0ABQ5SYS8_9ACTN|nr:flavin reductase family protein [Nocardioides luteus]MDR7312754.1 flavin reductase (DIM6/NTAB) family NADH-FMN oxidoreductase RutF [Nocardioides luteus]GGR47318.1 putative oxidoreductase [Nocardioides luteus]GLJ69006.1 putative oxidoreductase [Nocardioides luteus]